MVCQDWRGQVTVPTLLKPFPNDVSPPINAFPSLSNCHLPSSNTPSQLTPLRHHVGGLPNHGWLLSPAGFTGTPRTVASQATHWLLKKALSLFPPLVNLWPTKGPDRPSVHHSSGALGTTGIISFTFTLHSDPFPGPSCFFSFIFMR